MKALIGLIAAVAVVGGGYYLYTNNMAQSDSGARLMEGATATDPNSVMEQQDGHAAGETETGSWKDLMGMTGAHKCTVGTKTNGVESVGTVYVSGGTMRADFTTQVAGKNVDSHIIANSDVTYTWSSAMPQGIKSAGVTFGGETKANANPQGGFDPNVEVNYSCSPWTVDASIFSAPSNVEFMDVSAMMQGKMMPTR